MRCQGVHVPDAALVDPHDGDADGMVPNDGGALVGAGARLEDLHTDGDLAARRMPGDDLEVVADPNRLTDTELHVEDSGFDGDDAPDPILVAQPQKVQVDVVHHVATLLVAGSR